MEAAGRLMLGLENTITYLSQVIYFAQKENSHHVNVMFQVQQIWQMTTWNVHNFSQLWTIKSNKLTQIWHVLQATKKKKKKTFFGRDPPIFPIWQIFFLTQILKFYLKNAENKSEHFLKKFLQKKSDIFKVTFAPEI